MDQQPYGTAEADARVLAAVKIMRDLLVPRPGLLQATAEEVLSVTQDVDGGALPALVGHGMASGEAGDGRAARAAEAALDDLRDQLAALWRDRGEKA